MLATAKSPFTKWLSWILLSRFHSLYHIHTHTQRSEAHPGQWLPSVSHPETLSSSFIRMVNIQAVMALIVRCKNEKRNMSAWHCSSAHTGEGGVAVCVCGVKDCLYVCIRVWVKAAFSFLLLRMSGRFNYFISVRWKLHKKQNCNSCV